MNSASSPFYSIQLLNDLHNYFPELLYESERFQNVQDVLSYIRQVANQNPYTNGSNYYRRNLPQSHTTTSSPSPSSSFLPSSSSTASSFLPSSSSAASSSTTVASSVSRSVPSSLSLHNSGMSSSSRIRFTMPLQSSQIPVPHVQSSSDQILSEFLVSMLSGMGGGGSRATYSYENFLQPVVVRPTEDQINSSTYTMILQSNSQDNCAICQDPMEAQQEIRIIDHCAHSFHKMCIDPWFRENVRCPTCRYDIRESSSRSSS